MAEQQPKENEQNPSITNALQREYQIVDDLSPQDPGVGDNPSTDDSATHFGFSAVGGPAWTVVVKDLKPPTPPPPPPGSGGNTQDQTIIQREVDPQQPSPSDDVVPLQEESAYYYAEAETDTPVLNPDPSAALYQDPTQIDQSEQDSGFAYQSPTDPSYDVTGLGNPTDPYLTDPYLTDPLLMDPGTAGQDVQDQDFEGF